jgi:hypothetical protein
LMLSCLSKKRNKGCFNKKVKIKHLNVIVGQNVNTRQTDPLPPE